jgi:hypothetical protein
MLNRLLCTFTFRKCGRFRSAESTENRKSFVGIDGAERNFDRDFPSIFVSRRQSQPCVHRSHRWCAALSLT